MLARKIITMSLADFVDQLGGDKDFANIFQAELLAKSIMEMYLPVEKKYVAPEFHNQKAIRRVDDHAKTILLDYLFFIRFQYNDVKELEPLFGAISDRTAEDYASDCAFEGRVALFMLNGYGGPNTRSAFAAYGLRKIFKSDDVKIMLASSDCAGKNFVEIHTIHGKFYYDTLNPQVIIGKKIFESYILKGKNDDDIAKRSITRRFVSAAHCEALEPKIKKIQKDVISFARENISIEELKADVTFTLPLRTLKLTSMEKEFAIAGDTLDHFLSQKPRRIECKKPSFMQRMIKNGTYASVKRVPIDLFFSKKMQHLNSGVCLQFALEMHAMICKVRFNVDNDLGGFELLSDVKYTKLKMKSALPKKYDMQFLANASASVIEKAGFFSVALMYKCTDLHTNQGASYFAALKLKYMLSGINSQVFDVNVYCYIEFNRYVVHIIDRKNNMTMVYDPDFAADILFPVTTYESQILPIFDKLNDEAGAGLEFVMQTTVGMANDLTDAGREVNQHTEWFRAKREKTHDTNTISLQEFAQKFNGNEQILDGMSKRLIAFPPNGYEMPATGEYFSQEYSKDHAVMRESAVRAQICKYVMIKKSSLTAIATTLLLPAGSDDVVKQGSIFLFIFGAVSLQVFKSGSGYYRAVYAAKVLREAFPDDNIDIKLKISTTTRHKYIEIGNDKIGRYVIDATLNPTLVMRESFYKERVFPAYITEDETAEAAFLTEDISMAVLALFQKHKQTIYRFFAAAIKQITTAELLQQDEFRSILESIGIKSSEHVKYVDAVLLLLKSEQLENGHHNLPPAVLTRYLALDLIGYVSENNNEANKPIAREMLRLLNDVPPAALSDKRTLAVEIIADQILHSYLSAQPVVSQLFKIAAGNTKADESSYLMLGVALAMFDCLKPGGSFARAAIAAYHLRQMYPDEAVVVRINYEEKYGVYYVHFGNAKIGWKVVDTRLTPQLVIDSYYFHTEVLPTYKESFHYKPIQSILVTNEFVNFYLLKQSMFQLMFAIIVKEYLTIDDLLKDEEFLFWLNEKGIEPTEQREVLTSALSDIFHHLTNITQSLANIVSVDLSKVDPVLTVAQSAPIVPPQSFVPRVIEGQSLTLIAFFKKVAHARDAALNNQCIDMIVQLARKFGKNDGDSSQDLNFIVRDFLLKSKIFNELTHIPGAGLDLIRFYSCAVLASVCTAQVSGDSCATAYASIKLREIFDGVVGSADYPVGIEVVTVNRLNRSVVIVEDEAVGKFVYDPLRQSGALQSFADFDNEVKMTFRSTSSNAASFCDPRKVTSKDVGNYKANLHNFESKVAQFSDQLLDEVLQSQTNIQPALLNEFTLFASVTKQEKNLVDQLTAFGALGDNAKSFSDIFFRASPRQSALPKTKHVTRKYQFCEHDKLRAFMSSKMLEECYLHFIALHTLNSNATKYDLPVKADMNLTQANYEQFLVFLFHAIAFEKLRSGDSFSRAAYAANKLRNILPKGIDVSMRVVPGTNHYIVLLKKGSCELVFDAMLNADVLFNKEYYFRVIATVIKNQKVGFYFDLRITAEMCWAVNEIQRDVKEDLERLLRFQLTTAELEEDYECFLKDNYPGEKVDSDYIRKMQAMISEGEVLVRKVR